MKSPSSWIAFLLPLALAAVVDAAGAAAPAVRIGYPQLSAGSMPLWVMTDARLDQRYGVDVKSIYIAGGATLTRSLIAGDVDVALTGGAVVGAILSGAELVYAGIGLSTYAFSVYARPEIKTVGDLRGKVFGVITKGASSDHAAIALFNRYGMKAGQDVQFLYYARQGDLLASLDKGIVSAGVLSSPTTVAARRLGYKELVNIASFKLPYPHNAIATRRALVRQNPELIKGFLKSYVAAIKIVHEEPATAKRALARYLTKDPEMLDDAYGAAPLFLKVPYMPEEAIRTVLALSDHPKAASADPKDFFDNRPLKELEDSGFVKELYSGR
ncbi:MAG TPA: ABC transporter substrate-binding protein [Candidatus Binatia bacterium]|jgi:ABC-type nitrate/sulfonate/bicarbonate transport system substrate-binding protein